MGSHTRCVSRSPRLAVGAVGAGGAEAQTLRPGEHRPPVVGARRAPARVKPARVFPQGPPQVAALGDSARHVPHQLHDGRHLAESDTSQQEPQRCRGRTARGSRRLLKEVEPTREAVSHSNYGCSKVAWQCYTCMLSCS